MNEKGMVFVTAILVLTLMMGISLLMLQNTLLNQEQVLAFGVRNINLYGAESGVNHVVEFCRSNPSVVDITDPNWEYTVEGDLGHGSHYEATAYLVLDEYGVPLLFGDEDGDYIPEINTVTGNPLLRVISTGWHENKRKIRPVTIETQHRPSPPFVLPGAALWVYYKVNGNGVAGSIIGEGPIDMQVPTDVYDINYSNPPVPDIKYTIGNGTQILYDGKTGTSKEVVSSGSVYPWYVMKKNLLHQAQEKLTDSDISGNKLPEYTNYTDTFIHIKDTSGSGISLSQNITGSGILVVEGDFKVSGNFKWKGLVLVDGHLTMNGGGAANQTMIEGAMVVAGDAEALNGAVDIIYNGNIINNLYSGYTRYPRTSWREHHPVIRVLDNGVAIR